MAEHTDDEVLDETATDIGEGAGHSADAAAHSGAEEVALPQLDFSTFPNQIFWLIVTLVVMYLILSRVALPRISSVLAERHGTITNDVAAAEELKLRAQDAEAAYDKALADARSEAGRINAETKAEIQGELDKELARADEEISAKTAESERAIADIRASAMESVREVAKDTAQAIVEALGGNPDAGKIDAAVDARTKGGAA